MRYLFLSLCCIFMLASCQDKNKSSNMVFLGGQIVNPEAEYVILAKENETIDTLFLDNQNQFGKKLKGLTAGIYTFKHPPENQIMYIEPGDSLLIWLNTLDFDKSLNFSGTGAEKSSFLLDMFLLNQKNNDLILKYYKIEPREFAKLTDSIKKERIEKLAELKKSNKLSENFLNIAESSINYEFYDLRERYTFLIKKYFSEFADKIPANFNDYRKNIDFNNKQLQDYYVYTNFIDDFLRTKSIEYCDNFHNNKQDCYDLNDYRNIKRRIVLIDSLSNTPSIKNEFLDRLAVQSITSAEKKGRIDSILNLLKNIKYTNLEEAKNLAEIQKNYLIGESIADLGIRDTQGNLKTFAAIFDKPTIVYVWSIFAPAHHKWQHQLVGNLRKKYPEIDFYANNIDNDHTEEWLQVIETSAYNPDYEVQIANRKVGAEVYKKYLNKILFVDATGKIVKGDIHLNPPAEFEEKILEFLNQ